MRRKVSFVWKTLDGSWVWTSTHYEGNGIFFGKVTSPFVPQGEYGTWYVHQLIGNPAVRLVKGTQAELNKMLNSKQTQKAMELQKKIMGDKGW